MGPQQGKVTSPRCGLMKRRRVLGDVALSTGSPGSAQ